eukprot:TRINITY_DN9159_c0_g1_i1.p1 TRINITY_DN9159_c0_g1~~TRINITY_DN9159_c0_g1_i1.p1  ORF type:complete len:495 (+),score=68.10 TRINITY_DN9159_c0_g1_i1:1388-2872(+)
MLDHGDNEDVDRNEHEESTPAGQLVHHAMRIAKRNTLDRYLGLSGRVRSAPAHHDQPAAVTAILQNIQRKSRRKHKPASIDLELGKLFMVNREDKRSSELAERRNHYNTTFLDENDLKHRLTPDSLFKGNPDAIVNSVRAFLTSTVKSKDFFVYFLRKWRTSVVTVQRAVRKHLTYKESVINNMLDVWQDTQSRARKKLHTSMQKQLLSLHEGKVRTTAKGYMEQFLVPDELKRATVERYYDTKWQDLRRRVREWMTTCSVREKKLTVLKTKLRSSLQNNTVVHSERLIKSLNAVLWDIRALRLTSPKWNFDVSPFPFKDLLEAFVQVKGSAGALSLKNMRTVSESSEASASSLSPSPPPSSSGSSMSFSPVRKKSRAFTEDGHYHSCDSCLYCIAKNRNSPPEERAPLGFRRRFNSAVPVVIADRGSRPKSSRSKSLCDSSTTASSSSPTPSKKVVSSPNFWQPRPPVFPRPGRGSLDEALLRVRMIADDDSD